MHQQSIKINSILNVIKQLCAVIFPLITFPYITRVIGTANYGKINFSASVISYFSYLAALGISNYAVREGARIRDNKKKFDLFASQMYSINVITTIATYILLIVTYCCWGKLHSYTTLLVIQSMAIIFTTIGCDWVNTVFEDYRYLTVRYIVAQIIAIVSMFVFVKNENHYIVYAFITVLASSGVNLFNIVHIKRYVNIKFTLRNTDYRRHLRPMVMLFGGTIAATIYTSSDITLLGVFLDDTQVGLYSFSSRMYLIIKQLINAAYLVIVPRISMYLGKKEYSSYRELMKNALCALLTVILPASVGVFMISPQLVVIVGAAEFAEAAASLRILSVALIFTVVGYFFTSCALIPCREEKSCLIIAIIGASVNLILNVIVIPILGTNGAAYTTVLAEFLVFMCSAFVAKKYLGKLLKIKDVMGMLISCVGIVFCCKFFSFISNDMVYLFVAVLSSIVCYCVLLILTKNKTMHYLLCVLKKYVHK